MRDAKNKVGAVQAEGQHVPSPRSKVVILDERKESWIILQKGESGSICS